MMRTIRTTVIFKHSFGLGNADQLHPAGSYSIETDEELLTDVSFPAYRRVAISMQNINERHPTRNMPIAAIDPFQLEAAIFRDKS